MSLFDKLVVAAIPFMPEFLVWPFSKRYIAGKKLDDAVRIIKELQKEGACATIDLLGEHITKIEESHEARDWYLTILDRIAEDRLDANVSVKPTHMGLHLDKNACEQNIRAIVQKAASYNNFVRIDMEDTPYTDSTLEIYKSIYKDYPNNVGVVIQSYLRRTIDDIQSLMAMKANLRLCKGIYIEPRELAYREHPIIEKNFTFLLDELLKNGNYVGIATHKEDLIWDALKLIYDLKLPREAYEFQMLLGVDEQLRKIIIDAGHKMRIYVPFGEKWFAYSSRRLKENPRVARHVIVNLFHNFFGRK